MNPDQLRSTAERLLHRFHEDEPSPFLEPESDYANEIRDDAMALAEYVLVACSAPRSEPEHQLLPAPHESGVYRYPDGCAIWPSNDIKGRWVAQWADRVMLMGCDEQTGMKGVSYFKSPEEAAEALFDGGEGPARGIR